MKDILAELKDGDWVACLGLWMYIPSAADHSDIRMAIRMLERIELDRMQDPARYDKLLGSGTVQSP